MNETTSIALTYYEAGMPLDEITILTGMSANAVRSAASYYEVKRQKEVVKAVRAAAGKSPKKKRNTAERSAGQSNVRRCTEQKATKGERWLRAGNPTRRSMPDKVEGGERTMCRTHRANSET